MKKITVNASKFAKFKYFEYSRADKMVSKPVGASYEVGDVVVLNGVRDAPEELQLSVVLGCIDEVWEELRTDTDGMVSYKQCRHATVDDLTNSTIVATEKLRAEVLKYIPAS